MPSPTVFIIIGLAVALIVMITLSFVPVGGKKVFCPEKAVVGAKLIDSSNCASFSKTVNVGNADASNCAAFINTTSCKLYSDAATAACPAVGSGTATPSAASCAIWSSSQPTNPPEPYYNESWCKNKYTSLTTSTIGAAAASKVCTDYIKLLDGAIRTNMITVFSSSSYVLVADSTSTLVTVYKGPLTAQTSAAITAWLLKSTTSATVPTATMIYDVDYPPATRLTTRYYMYDDAASVKLYASNPARYHYAGADIEIALKTLLTSKNSDIFTTLSPIKDTTANSTKTFYVIDHTKLTNEVIRLIKESKTNTYAGACLPAPTV
jgi:hypothetical protein